MSILARRRATTKRRTKPFAPTRSISAYQASGTSITATFAETPALDSTYLLVAIVQSGSTTTVATPSGWVADSAGGNNSTDQVRTFYKQGDGSTNSVTVTVPNAECTLFLMAFPGYSSTTPLGNAGTAGASGTSASPGSIAANAFGGSAYGVAICAVGVLSTVTWGSWTVFKRVGAATGGTTVGNASQRLDVGYSEYIDSNGQAAGGVSWTTARTQRIWSAVLPLTPPTSGGSGTTPVVTVRSSSSDYNNTSSLSIPVPTGAAVNDIMIALASADINSGTLSPPDGTWTQLDVKTQSSPDGQLSAVFWKRLTAADTGNYTFTVNTGSWFDVAVTCFAGASTTSPPTISTANVNTSSNSSPVTVTANGLTASDGDALMYLAAADTNGQYASIWTKPTGFTDASSEPKTGTSWTQIYTATKVGISAGATGNVSATLSDAGGGWASGYAAWLVDIPAGSGGGSGGSGPAFKAVGSIVEAYSGTASVPIPAVAVGDYAVMNLWIDAASAAPTISGWTHAGTDYSITGGNLAIYSYWKYIASAASATTVSVTLPSGADYLLGQIETFTGAANSAPTVITADNTVGDSVWKSGTISTVGTWMHSGWIWQSQGSVTVAGTFTNSGSITAISVLDDTNSIGSGSYKLIAAHSSVTAAGGGVIGGNISPNSTTTVRSVLIPASVNENFPSYLGLTPNPASNNDGPSSGLALGQLFTVKQSGFTATGVRFYKPGTNTTNVQSVLWDSSNGAVLATSNFVVTTTVGWMSLPFTTPYTLATGSENYLFGVFLSNASGGNAEYSVTTAPWPTKDAYFSTGDTSVGEDPNPSRYGYTNTLPGLQYTTSNSSWWYGIDLIAHN